jgi:hypothetical protein
MTPMISQYLPYQARVEFFRRVLAPRKTSYWQNFVRWLNWNGWLFMAADAATPSLRKTYEREAAKIKYGT